MMISYASMKLAPGGSWPFHCTVVDKLIPCIATLDAAVDLQRRLDEEEYLIFTCQGFNQSFKFS
jgi:hypothetical protein